MDEMKHSEKGFTIIELALTISLIAVIGGAASMSIFQVVKGTERSNDHMTATRQVQNAGYWISHDTHMAQTVVTGDDPETTEDEFVTLKHTDWESGNVHTIIYTFENMPGGLKKLKRQHLTHDAGGEEIGNETTFVAQNIDSASSSFSEQDGAWKLTIQTRSGTETETREYEIIPRSSL